MIISAYPILLGLALSFILIIPAFGQVADPDSSASPRAVAYAKTLYHRALGTQEHLYSGSEYVDFNIPQRGHQYYKTREWEEANIFFDGILYQRVPILYDISQDQVLVTHPSEEGIFVKIKLNNDRIGYFTFLGDTFVQIRGNTSSDTPLEPGLYQQLYDGEVGVVAKRIKTRQDQIESQTVISVFTQRDRYYIRKDGQYYPVKSKGSVLQVFKEHKKELSQHLRKSGVKFRENREAAIITLAKHYDALRDLP